MRDLPWWKRWTGLPWENHPDADVRTGFVAQFLTTHAATLLLASLVVIFGIAVSYAAKRAWLMSLVLTAIGIVVTYGSYLLWRKLTGGRH